MFKIYLDICVCVLGLDIFLVAVHESRYTRFSLNLVSRQIEDFTTQIASLFFVVTFHGRYQLIFTIRGNFSSKPAEERNVKK